MKNKSSITSIIIGAGVIFFLGIVVSMVILSYTDTLYQLTITDKERITESDGDGGTSSKYLIYGESESGEVLVFENTDSLLRVKFNSSNFQGQLKRGEQY